MSPQDFLVLLRLQPFKPFRIHLNGGETFEVRHSENASVRKSVVWLFYPAKEFPVPLAEQEVVVVLRNISHVDFLPKPSTPSPN